MKFNHISTTILTLSFFVILTYSNRIYGETRPGMTTTTLPGADQEGQHPETLNPNDTYKVHYDMLIKFCKSIRTIGEEVKGLEGTEVQHRKLSGKLRTCEGYADSKWAVLTKGRATINSHDHFKYGWNAKFHHEDDDVGQGGWSQQCEDIISKHETPSAKTEKDLKLFVESVVRKSKDEFKRVQDCEVLAVVTGHSDTMSDATNDSLREKTSVDKKLSCISHGVETQDYKACARLVNAYDGAMFGQQGLEGYQAIDQQKSGVDAQIDMMKNQADPANALKAMKTGVEKQKEIAGQNTGFHTAKLGGLFALYKAMPTHETVFNDCTQTLSVGGITAGKSIYKRIMDAAQATNSSGPRKYERVQSDVEKTCRKITILPEIVVNGYARDASKAIMVQAGVDAAKFAAITAMLDSQLGKIDKSINAIEEYQPVDNPYLAQQDLLIEQCKADPTLPECQYVGYNTPFGFQQFSYDFGGAPIDQMTEGSLGDPIVESSPQVEDPTDGTSTSGGLIEIPGDMNKGGGFVDNPPPAAVLKDAESGAAGGGGGAPPGGGGGGGSGGPVQGEPNSNKSVTQKITDSSKTYGQVGGASYTGGTRSPAARKRDSGNPFDKLFGKKKVAVTHKTNYYGKQIRRGPASLFTRLTDRYKMVQSSKRLLSYEQTK